MARSTPLAALLIMFVTSGWASDSRPSGTSVVTHLVKTQNSGGMSSGRSRSSNRLVERVVEHGPDGLVLEYDPGGSREKRRGSASWMFPVRVRREQDGRRSLENEPTITKRLALWLKAHPKFDAYCGRYIFTWTAIKIECDPKAALATVEPFDLRFEGLADGATYSEADALAPASVRHLNDGTYVVRLQLDPDALRRAEAETAVIVNSITGRGPMTVEDAMKSLGEASYTGERTITFVVDAHGEVRTRTRVTNVRKSGANGQTETRETTERVERKPG